MLSPGTLDWEVRVEEWRRTIEEYYDHNSELASKKANKFVARVVETNRRKRSETYNFSNCGYVQDESESENKNAYVTFTSSSTTINTSPTSSSVNSSPPDSSPPLPHTLLLSPSHHVTIVTSAALPWMTGTAVNPLLRAAYLLARKDFKGVTIMLPWLERPEDQQSVYGNKAFKSREEQEAYVRNWLKVDAGLPEASERLKICWYDAWQQKAENSVYSMGDITALIPNDEADICILEEPEHLNWYRAPGESWTSKFDHVVGIVHTNYFAYALDQPASIVRAPAMRFLCSWMVRAHCHKVVKLSGALLEFAEEKEVVENVHGVRKTFLDVGRKVQEGPSSIPADSVYFIGKMLYSKGIGTLVDLLSYASSTANLDVTVDMYGSGPDLEGCKSLASKTDTRVNFKGPVDHSELGFTHKVFVNPSTSEVLCTTIAEALAMGKFVVCASHPSNDFFTRFPNCLPYSNKEEFVGNLYYALTHDPEPMSEEHLRELSWEAATERFVKACEVTQEERDRWIVEDGIRVKMPSLVRDETVRKEFKEVLERSRERYRNFKNRIRDELDSPLNPLPRSVKEKLKQELDRKLDLDFERILSEPELRLQLSPAELDKSLLELYNQVSVSPGGDILRVIGGGTDVGRQNQYIQQKSQGGEVDRPRFEQRFGQRAARGVQRVLEDNLARQNKAFAENLSNLNVGDNEVGGRVGGTSSLNAVGLVGVGRRRPRFPHQRRPMIPLGGFVGGGCARLLMG
ncbi:hypothetical protein TrVE_jg10459 [Triparma verrucosa]|uniref:Digalactosyldiacylglycerol synthase n=1 Tax=Triparma verrucosa TaxID=1606542 RepID=A0A9W7F9D3_9STRA|nr:hypothetical protein TrVE_jg10459 [Triparma verrucosa]